MTTMTTITIELRELADKFSEGWHDGIKIDACDVMLMTNAADEIERLRAALAAPATVQEPVACLVETEGGAMVWPIDDFDEAGTYCEPDEFPVLLYRATVTDEQLRKDAERYATLRRGQKWSVVDGIGDTLRAEELDAAIDAAMKGTP